jgi:hypothetical protein
MGSVRLIVHVADHEAGHGGHPRARQRSARMSSSTGSARRRPTGSQRVNLPNATPATPSRPPESQSWVRKRSMR